jgi:hypothetical protein
LRARQEMEFIARSATETSYGNTVRILAAPPAHDIACSFQALPSFAPKERRAANRMTDNHQDDARLIAALESACGAQRVKEPASLVPSHELMNPIIEAMESHPKFGKALTRHFGPKRLLLNPQSQAYHLPKIAVERGPSAAVAWCHKVYSTEHADLRYVSLVYGLLIEQTHTLSNGVSLMRLANLPPSANAEGLQYEFPSMSTTPVPIGATFEVQKVAYSERSSFDPFDLTRERSDEIERTIRAFTLAEDANPTIAWLAAPMIYGLPRGWAPVTDASWIEFVDHELAAADIAYSLLGNPASEVARTFYSHTVDTDAIKWVEQYISLAPEVKSQCDIAIDRLNLARRRLSPGDKAIEGAIWGMSRSLLK